MTDPGSFSGLRRLSLRSRRGDQSRDQEHRQIISYLISLYNDHCYDQLPDIVAHASGNTDPCHAEPVCPFQQRHDCQAQNAAGKAVYDTKQAPKDKSGKYDPHHGQQERFPPVSLIQHDHNDQIGQAEFDARNSELDRISVST